MNRRRFLQGCGAALLLPWRSSAAEATNSQKTLFAMDTWFWQAPPELDVSAQVDLLKKLGYGGMALSWGQKHNERLKALLENNLTMVGCYITVDIDGTYPQHLADCVQFLKGSDARVWLALTSRKHKKSDATGDEAARAIANRCADQCKEAGIPGIALYPHVGFWMEHIDHAVRLAAQVKRPEVGLQFNQYHWMVADRGENLRASLESALPWLRGVSINGSNKNPPSILPLSEGDYDITPILRTLYELKYAGPISHQGYSIKGNLPERLAAAKQTWDKLQTQILRGA